MATDEKMRADAIRATLPGKLRASATALKAEGRYREAKEREDEATRIEQGKGFKLLAQRSPGEKAVINRLHAREAARKRTMSDVGVLLIGGAISLGVAVWAWKRGK
jgi:type VI protein secretion system component VasF